VSDRFNVVDALDKSDEELLRLAGERGFEKGRLDSFDAFFLIEIVRGRRQDRSMRRTEILTWIIGALAAGNVFFVLLSLFHIIK
jgi:hypothetical protein